jgi:starvation-inducible DNA-binding protein
MNARLRNSPNDLPEEVRLQTISLLNQHLADALDLALQAKQAHWIAERAVELGGTALGTVRVAAERSRLPEYPLHISSGREHVRALSVVLARFGKSARAAIDAAATLGDADTADLYTEVARGVDKLLWKIEAHAQTKD